jgi:receptor protein-tyrosine kinase
MSIIEKAAGKMGGRTAPTMPASPPVIEDSEPSGIVERALDANQRAPQGRLEPTLATEAQAVQERAGSPAGKSATVELNLGRLKRMGAITPDAERSQTAEEFRLIKRPLIANAFGLGTPRVKNGNLIMVTSSLPGEGKTFTALNLAISMAMEMERTVLLVDADVARPRLMEYLGVRVDKGLLDVLRDPQVSMSDVMIQTSIPNLRLLPAGQTYKRATELLASASMTRLVEEMAKRYPDRIIVFDSPPLLSTSEASVLATHMGQIVMVVEAEKTSEEALREALRQIEACEVVGMVLNKAVAMPGTDYYYGYYGYGTYGK